MMGAGTSSGGLVSRYLFVHRYGTGAAQSLLLDSRGCFRWAEYQGASVQILARLMKFQGKRVAVARLAGVVRARAVLLLAGAVALRGRVPSGGVYGLVRLVVYRVMDVRHRGGRGGRSVIGLGPVLVLVRGRVDRFAVRFRYSLVDVLRFAPHVAGVGIGQFYGVGLLLTPHAQSLHLLRAVLERFLHPLFAIVRVMSRRGGGGPTGLLRGLGGAGRRGGRVGEDAARWRMLLVLLGRVTRDGGRRFQRGSVLFRFFGSFLGLLLLLTNQLLDQAVLVRG